MLTLDERRLQRVLRILVGVFPILALLYLLAPVVGPFRDLFGEPPFVAINVARYALLMLLCMYAAGDLRQRHGLVAILVGAQVVSIAAMLIFMPLVDGTASVRTLLLSALALDVLIALALIWFAFKARSAGRAARSKKSAAETARALESRGMTLTAADWVLGVVLFVLGAVYLLATVTFIVGPLFVPMRAFFVELPFVAGSAAMAMATALLCFYILTNLRTRLALTSLIVCSHLVLVVAAAFLLIFADVSGTLPLHGHPTGVGEILWLSIAFAAGVAVVLWLLKTLAFHARFRPKYLGATGYRALIAMADVIVAGPDETVPPRDIARTADNTLENIRAVRKWLQRMVVLLLQLHPILYLKAPFSELDHHERLRHLKTHFQRDVTLRLIPNWWRNFVQVMIRVAKQLTYVGYYSDRRTDASIGYVRFEERPEFPELQVQGPDVVPSRKRSFPLDVKTPESHEDRSDEADVCVIGSGAAGAILAYHLAEAGKEVIVLERGQYVPPPAFSSDEVEMMSRLYADGLFQQTRDFQFTVLQGSCVGGSTVINNAVCFAPPEHVLAKWNDKNGYDAGLNLDDLRASVQFVERWLEITPQDPSLPQHPNLRLNPSAPKYLDGIKKLNLTHLDVGPVRANIKGCLGCGYCNIGCAYGKKLSMLDTALPWAQKKFPGKVRIYSECEVTKIETSSRVISRRATAVEAQIRRKRKITVRAEKIVVAAGAVASPYLLLRSKIGKGLPVGDHACFNMGAPLTAEYDDKMDAYDGLQISHYGVPPAQRGWVLETWWNPPVAQAINMPGWFEQHYENMRRYPYLMAVGALVGTERNAKIRPALTGGPDVVYVPTQGDLQKLADALVELGQILFAGGAKRVMLNGWNFYEFTDASDLSEIQRIVRDPTDITLGTGHPQGGCAISQNPKLGVVGPDLRVHGYQNLFVCDASVFPGSVTVNPQLTVMGLAHYAAPRIAAAKVD